MSAQTKFDECRITEAHLKQYDRTTGKLAEAPADKMGCTGKLDLSSEYKTIVKNCEGVQTNSVKKLTKISGTMTLHMPLKIARLIFGLSKEGLAEGVYGLSDTTNSPDIQITAKIIDLFTEEEKYICIPKASITSGFTKSIDNTVEEIAEVEVTFDGAKDENNEFYYEAIASEIDKEQIGDKWLTQFTPELVKAPAE